MFSEGCQALVYALQKQQQPGTLAAARPLPLRDRPAGLQARRNYATHGAYRVAFRPPAPQEAFTRLQATKKLAKAVSQVGRRRGGLAGVRGPPLFGGRRQCRRAVGPSFQVPI
jgi:hypothetical protein